MTRTRRTPTPPTHMHTIQIESTGNGRIVNRNGLTVGVLEDWRLTVNGRDIGEVDSYHEAVMQTGRVLDSKT